MLKTILFTHDDLDGAGCRIIFTLAHKHLKENEYKILNCSNKSIDDDVLKEIELKNINSKTVICFADICPSQDILKKLADEGYKNINIWDHHPTNFFAEWIIPNAVIVPKNECGKLESGTSLIYQHYFNISEMPLEKIKNQELLSLLVDSIRAYDTFEWKSTNNMDAKKIQTLYFLIGINRFCDKYIKRVNDNNEKLFSSSDLEFIDAKIENEQKFINSVSKDNVYIVNIRGLKAALRISNAGMNISDLSNQFLTKNPDIDIFIGFNLLSKTFQFRTNREDLDLGELLAKPIGGGGHPKAAGASIPQQSQEAILQVILDSIDPNWYLVQYIS